MKITKKRLKQIIKEEYRAMSHIEETNNEGAWDLKDCLVKQLGADGLLDELLRVMNAAQAMEYLEFIASQYELDGADEEVEETVDPLRESPKR